MPSIKLHLLLIFCTSIILQCKGDEDIPCIPKSFGDGNIVCVCNETYCDTLNSLPHLPRGQFWSVVSTKAGQRFQKTQYQISANRKINSAEFRLGVTQITLNHNKRYQTIEGFGGAFTDAATINILNLTQANQQQLLSSYFSPQGLEYTFGRVPMGGCDFSTHLYTYDDNHEDDFDLTFFALADEDINYKIPIILRAQAMSNRTIKMYSSPWSAPAWMKTNNNLTGKGELRGNAGEEYYQAWALYFVKFLQEYAKNNITFWGVTAQNEPLDGNIENFEFNCMGFTAEKQRVFIGTNLGPTLEQNGFGNVKILMLDDQRLLLPQWAQEVLRNDSNAKDYVDGIAIHWYLDFLVTSAVLDQTHALFPNKFILATEACEGSLPWDPKVIIGSWKRGENYIFDIIDDLLHWTVGWVDWNIALNMEGGPNWTGTGDDSPIIINHDANEFYKQPMFYAMGHFSKFVPPGCVVIDSQSSVFYNSDFLQIAFDCPDGSTVIVILNRGLVPVPLSITDPNVGTISIDIAEQSFNTLVWWSS